MAVAFVDELQGFFGICRYWHLVPRGTLSRLKLETHEGCPVPTLEAYVGCQVHALAHRGKQGRRVLWDLTLLTSLFHVELI